MDIWSTARKLAETARDVLTEEQQVANDSISEENPELREAWQDIDRLTSLCEKLKSQTAQDEEEMKLVKDKLRQSEAERESERAASERAIRKLKEEHEAASKAMREEQEAAIRRLKVEQQQRGVDSAVMATVNDDSLELEEARRKETELEALVHKLREEAAQLRVSLQEARADTTLRMQVESLSQQLALEREGTQEERSQEAAAVARLQNELDQAREREKLALEREQVCVAALGSARERIELMRVHLLERDEELEQLAQSLAASKELNATLDAELQAAQEAATRARGLERLLAEKERALANLEEAVGQMSEDHRAETARRERLLRDKFADEFAAKLALRERELSAAGAALAAKNEALELEMGRVVAAVGEKEKKIELLLNEISPLRETLAETMKKLTEAIDKDQFAVDKRLIANLVAAYFTHDKSKRDEVLRLILRILDVPKAQRESIYAGATRGWFGTSKFSEDEDGTTQQEKSLGDMWIEYLMKEAGATEEAGQAAVAQQSAPQLPPPPPAKN